MSGLPPYDHGMNMPMPNMMGSTYPAYDGNFSAAYPRLSGPPTHFDGVAFWYNPTNTEQLYDRETSLLGGRGVALPATSMEASGIKHRRTRSGCFTCRSRRVKVIAPLPTVRHSQLIFGKCDETRPTCDRRFRNSHHTEPSLIRYQDVRKETVTANSHNRPPQQSEPNTAKIEAPRSSRRSTNTRTRQCRD